MVSSQELCTNLMPGFVARGLILYIPSHFRFNCGPTLRCSYVAPPPSNQDESALDQEFAFASNCSRAVFRVGLEAGRLDAGFFDPSMTCDSICVCGLNSARHQQDSESKRHRQAMLTLDKFCVMSPSPDGY